MSDIDASFTSLIAMMEHLSEPWGIKDRESRHIYMNKAALLYTNTPLNFDIVGKTDAEFPADWAECADDLQEHDDERKHHAGKRRLSKRITGSVKIT